MKTKLTLLAVIIVITAKATVFTLTNDPAGGAQFNTGSLDAPYNAASAGDTILIEGTNSPYTSANGMLRWNKKLTLIGIGFNPNKTNPRHAIISCINVNSNSDVYFGTGGNGSRFYGIDFTPFNTGIFAYNNISNYSFENCLFSKPFSMDGQTVSNITFRNCIFTNSNNQNVFLSANGIQNTNILITNCIFSGYFEGNSNSTSSVTIDHCLFLCNTGTVPIQNLQGGVVKNSIFMNNATIANNCINNVFDNNLSRLGTTYPPAGNTGSNNVANTDPLFVTYTAPNAYSSSHNYHLQTGSLAIGIANDGTDDGVHGGTSHFSESGEVLINPIIRSMNINNTSVAPNGNLNVHINATKPSDN